MIVKALKPFFDGKSRRPAGTEFELPPGAKACPKWCVEVKRDAKPLDPSAKK